MKRLRNDVGRQVIITPNYLTHPEGSVLIETGNTKVICTASVENKVNDWLRGKGKGWVTAEYAMLPRANASRNKREGQFGRWPSSRSQEIQRLIARALRASVWPARLGEITITIDCDVIQADGGTRTASITGGWVALALALEKLQNEGRIKNKPLKRQIAAVSVGMKNGDCLLDLNYDEDSSADVDLNIAADDKGGIVEVQGTAEGQLYSFDDLTAMTQLGLKGITALTENQRITLTSVGISLESLMQRPEEL
ncbi:MAG: ribonuclease PH [Deltaproteobacteria bacterium]|nr:ribonuclease PH [Deltaproteobacteria bacterium]MBN2674353.1 ribonuclease PH [Deltaproteobacteria bacterium]